MIDEDILRFFPQDGVYEVILSTKGETKNASPIGIRREGKMLYALVFRDTVTFSNLSKEKKCSLTLSHNPEKFYRALVGQLNDVVKVTEEGYPYLPGNVVILADCVISNSGNPVRVDVVPKGLLHCNDEEDFYAFSRADSLFIDALVHLTRLDIESEDQREILIRLMFYELSTAKRLKPSLGPLVDEIASRLIKAYKL